MIEENYPLSPMQQGMLFHSLYEQSSGVYIEQVICSLHENVNVSNLIQSWQRVVERHSILRTGFDWDDSHNLQHSVYKEVKLPIEQQNWQNMSLSEQSSQLNAYLKGDRQKGFNIAEAPLMRFALFQLAETDYKLVWTFHHALLDGRSIVIILKEVFSFYKAFGQNQELKLEPAHPYGNYIDWLGQQSLIEAEKFWKQQLQGFQAPIQLLVDTKSEVETKSYNTQKIRLSQECTSALQDLAQENELTLNTLVQGAWALLLNRYSGQDDVVFGATRACRRSALKDMDSMVGLFINTLPVRVQVDFDKPLLLWLKELSAQWISLSDYKHTPLVKIQEWSEVPKRLSLFESLLVFENYELNTALHSQGENWESREFELFEQPNYPLTLTVYPESELILKIDYDSSRFDAETIGRILGHLETLLNGFIANPQQCLGRLPLLTAAEKHQLLVEWNDTEADYPKDKCIHQLFEEQVERTPDNVALVFEDEQLTYQELNAKANQLAHYLQKLGVGPEVLVGICVERSLEMVVGLLGILKAGGAYVPLDPKYPKDHLAFMLSDAQVSVLLTQQTLVDLLSQHSARVVYLDTDDFSVGEGVDNPTCKAQSSNLAYVLYTSGSTGKPKGVTIEHRSPVALLSWATKAFTTEQLAGVLASTSFCFDLSIFEIFAPLYSGGKVILAKDALHLPTLAAADEVTLINTVPSAIAELVRVKGIPDGVHTVNLAGEALPQRVVELLYQQGTIQEVFNLYGPSEDTVYSTYALVRRDCQKVPPIGHPIANTQVYILDDYQRPVPINVPGELHLGGAGLARGYFNRPELTKEKFIFHSFYNEPKIRLYKTGDLVRYLPDGNIEFLGRIDHQVKIRGYRIELGEIEAVLGQHSAVREVVVVAREDVSGDKRLFAFVAVNQKQTIASKELRCFLKNKLPDYMIPTAFVALNKLPRTLNGKVERRALPIPDNVRAELEETFVAPRTPVEEVLVGIWAEVLGFDKVGVLDNFFELGGHSLLATQIISRLREAFQLEFNLCEIFEYPILSDLANKIELVTQTEQKQTQTLPNIPIIARNKNLPLSLAQEHIWFFEQLFPFSAIYNLPKAIRIKGLLKLKVLEQCLNEIVKRHEVMRTSFTQVNGEPVQIVHPFHAFILPVVYLHNLPYSERESKAEELASEEAQQIFYLESGLLWRIKLLRLSEEDHLLLLNMHHIIFDAWSVGVLIHELAILYEAFLSEKQLQLPEIPIQYVDFAVWQRQWLQGKVLDSQLNYWKRKLQGELPILELPTDLPRPNIQTYQGSRYILKLSKSLTTSLKAISRKENVTLFITLMAAFNILLYRYTGQKDILVGTPVANRNRKETERLIGCFTNVVVIRTYLGDKSTVQELITRVRKTVLEAYSYQDIPFGILVKEIQPERDLSRNPLFKVMFAIQNAPMPASEFSNLTWQSLDIDNKTVKLDLNICMVDSNEGLIALIDYNVDLFNESTIKRMADHLQVLLEQITFDQTQYISNLQILTEVERHQLLVEWNHTKKVDDPLDKCIHQLFEQQVERTPDNVAVVFENQHLTYQELNERANQLAHYLRKLGVKPEVLVGICVKRSLEMVVGVLGILKAGGAYVPLDPEYPKERLAFMLKDTKTPVILTQKHLVEYLPKQTVKVVCLDIDWKFINQENCQNPVTNIKVDNLAYVIYTSGSTGTPKGVLLCHLGLVNRILWGKNALRFSAKDRLIQRASFSFDVSVAELFTPLLAGAGVILPRPGYHNDIGYLLTLIAQHQVTLISLPPSILPVFLEESRLDVCQSLRLVCCSGESLTRELQERLFNRLGVEISHKYGPTEATISVLAWLCERENCQSVIPIGRPIANTQIYVLDSNLQPVPVGVPGELHIGGICLARGYLNRPDLTAEKFIPNPFSSQQRERLYKTGDLVRYLPDGNIEFLGRIDYQVKIRGIRIELGEIEAVLGQHSAVREVVVVAHKDVLGDKRLIAYIVANKNQTPTIDELRNFLKQSLPNYMLPSVFVILKALPLTPNGKIDRRALPAPDNRRQKPEKTFIAPRNDLELQLAHIWEKILDIRPIGIKDNFFNLGGHSLLAVRLFSQIEQKFSNNIPLATLFQAPTIEQLASVIRKKEWSAQWRSLVPIQPLGLKTPLFCVHALGPSVLYYQNLALHLGLDRPFYGLQAQGLDGKQPPLTKIEDMAAYYIKEIQTIQPEGDYLIGGSSFGGKVALEIAQQLIAKGQTVALLVLFDSTAPGCFTRIPVNQRISHHFDNFLQLGPNYILKKITGKFQWIKNRTKERIQRASFKFSQKHITSFAQTHPNQIVERANKQAAREYVPQIYPGKVALFRAINQSAPEGWSVDPKRGWGKLASGELEVYEVPGGHNSMFREPHVRMLAEKLRVSINNATAKKVTS
jgi:amino acid adenylation domain-containing protein